jgi:P27 family predicted phage terminase small subunit
MPQRHNPLRVVTGTGHRPVEKPAKYDATPPKPPANLPADGKSMWKYLVAKLAPTGVLDNTDRYAIELLCSAYAEWRQAAAKYREQPLGTGSTGQPVRSPWWDIQNAAAERLRKMLIEMGLTPAARVKLGILQQRNDALGSDIDAILSGK